MTKPKTRPVILRPKEVRAAVDGRLTMLWRPMTAANSTVNGYSAKPFWPDLLFEHARPMDDSTALMAITGKHESGRDVHLSVPYRHPKDPAEDDVNDYARYRVRPRWTVGTVLWGQETWTPAFRPGEGERTGILYAADGAFRQCHHETAVWSMARAGKWRPSSIMPFWASRPELRNLVVTGVEVRRVQSISWTEAIAAGCKDPRRAKIRVDAEHPQSPLYQFREFWDRHTKCPKHKWAENPWAWAGRIEARA